MKERKGAKGFDREVGGKEACRVSAFPYPGRIKHNCRLLRVCNGRLMRPHHLGFPPASSPEWCETSGIVSPDAYIGWRKKIGSGREKPVGGCFPFETKNTD